MKDRVVITGIGVISPNGLGVEDFHKALVDCKSGISFFPDAEELNFRCQIGGQPQVDEEYASKWLPPYYVKKISNRAIIYGCLSGIEAWTDAGLPIEPEQVDGQSGIIFGSGAMGLDPYIGDVLQKIDAGNSKRLGSGSIPESMSSGASAYLNRMLGLGNRVMSNSSACITGSEAVLLGYEHIKSGRASRMLCGSTEGDGRYIWAGFDAFRVLCSDSNDNPTFGSRPMSDSSAGFIPSAGSGALVLETLESAVNRGAKIYAEILGGEINSGGQRNGGSMTAPNSEAVIECLKGAIKSAEIDPREIDLISGHLTSTKADDIEVLNWTKALGLSGDDFPLINAPKSMIGHCIAGAGSIELVASILQLEHGFVHGNLNSEKIKPEILELIPRTKIPLNTVFQKIDTLIKANFGFGDLNCAIVLKNWKDE